MALLGKCQLAEKGDFSCLFYYCVLICDQKLIVLIDQINIARRQLGEQKTNAYTI